MTMATAENGAVRVMIVDDDSDMRLLLRATLGSDERVDIVAEAADGNGAVDAFRSATPDVCILDYRMPGLDGLEAAAQILGESPGTTILLFSAFLTGEVAEAAESLGVRCVRKDAFMDLPAEVVRLVNGS